MTQSLARSIKRVTKPGTGELRHGTEGWGPLETSCRALGQMLEGCGPSCRQFLTPDFIELVSRWVGMVGLIEGRPHSVGEAVWIA